MQLGTDTYRARTKIGKVRDLHWKRGAKLGRVNGYSIQQRLEEAVNELRRCR